MFRALFSALSPRGARARLSILIFHRVLAEPDPLFPGEITREQFDAICAWLRAWCNVLPLGPAVKALKDGTLPSRAVAITFDDGYADNHALAAPILARHGLSATFFVATEYLDGGRMWNDTIIEAVRRTPLRRLNLSEIGEGVQAHLDVDGMEARRAAIAHLLGRLKYRPVDERERLCELVAFRAEVEPPSDLMMSSEQVADLHRAGMQIGAHTAAHPILATLPDDQALEEIRLGKERLEEIVGQPITLFAYPNGRPDDDYTYRTVALVKRAGFEAAFTTAWGAADADSDPHQMPRFTPWDRGRFAFGLRLAYTLWQSRRSRFSTASPAASAAA